MVFETRTVFLKWVSSSWWHDQNVIFKIDWITSFWTQILHLNFKENIEKMI